MNKQVQKIIKVGISGLVVESKTPKRVLLIKRENPPLHNQWSFPGGKLEYGELVAAGIKREVMEETGYNVEVVDNFYNSSEIIREDYHYIILSGCCLIKNQSDTHEQIHKQFFYLDQYFGKDPNEKFNLSDLNDSECVPNLKFIIQKMLKLNFNIQPLNSEKQNNS